MDPGPNGAQGEPVSGSALLCVCGLWRILSKPKMLKFFASIFGTDIVSPDYFVNIKCYIKKER